MESIGMVILFAFGLAGVVAILIHEWQEARHKTSKKS